MSKFKESLREAIITDECSAERAVLLSTTKLGKIEDPHLRELLQALYSSGSLKQRALACMINGVFTELKCTFLFSRDILANLIKSDPNIRRATISGSDYKIIWSYIFGNNHFEAVKSEANGLHRASVVTLSMRQLVSEFDLLAGREFRKLQKEKCVELFDSYELKNAKTSSKTSSKTSPKYKGEDEDDFKAKDLSVSFSETGEQEKTNTQAVKPLKNTNPGEYTRGTGESKRHTHGEPEVTLPPHKDLNAQWDAVDIYFKRISASTWPTEIKSDFHRLKAIIEHGDTSEASRAFFLDLAERQYLVNQVNPAHRLTSRKCRALSEQEDLLAGRATSKDGQIESWLEDREESDEEDHDSKGSTFEKAV